MMKSYYRILIFIFLLVSCERTDFYPRIILRRSESQMYLMYREAIKNDAIPRSADNNGIRWIKNNMDWTEGFWPGMCWMIYQFSGDSVWASAAVSSQNKFIAQRFDSSTHDLGFIFNNSFGKAYRISGEEKYKAVLIDAANSLASRYNPVVGCIKSWDWAPDRWQFPVIIDNMMNLELLFEASGITGDPLYRNIAVEHANTTMKNHFRKDYSSFHVVDYDTLTGKAIRKQTHQGFADSSAWARGQSWGLYGYTICFRYTRDSVYLNQAQHIADYILQQLPADGVSCWDYLAPDSLKNIRDASAAAILASALIELGNYSKSIEYHSVALKIIKTLSSPVYFPKSGTNHFFILKHSVGSFPENSEVDVPIIYADYYYIEAVMRLQLMNESGYLRYDQVR